MNNSTIPATKGAQESVYIIQKMDCPTEEGVIRNKLAGLRGIEELRFNLMQRELTVRHHLDDEQSIEEALNALGMEPIRKERDASVSVTQPDSAMPHRVKILVAISGMAAVVAEIVSWIGNDEKSTFVIVLSIAAVLTGGVETAKKGWIALRTLTLNINFLMTIAIMGALAIGEWPEAAMVTFLFALAELIESYSLDRARNAIRGLMEMSPEVAAVMQPDGSFISAPAGGIAVGAVVRVKPGERVPLDGKVTSGHSTVNQAPITGESMPVEKMLGDTVFAGTINERGMLEFQVTANKGNTTLARIIRSVQAAQGERAPTQRFVDRFARYYTPGIVLFAILIAGVPPLVFGAPFLPWAYKALVMLVIACPCALVISTPVTIVSGLAAAARRGILIKGGVYLEEGCKLKALALDKTGTLTRGQPEVTNIVPFGDETDVHYLLLAASLDAHSEHPVASAIIARWEREPGEHRLLDIVDFESITGRGVKGRIDGILYYIGNHRLIEELKICGPQVETILEKYEKEGKTVVVLATERQPLCVFAVADTIRESSVQAIAEMQAQGIHCVMLTGDNESTAQVVGSLVGIESVRGNMLPDDKLQAVEELRRRFGVVGMVGDGINDAPALAKSSIGFAMGAAGTDTALETADVALMKDDLRGIPLFIALSRKTAAVLKQNIALAIGIKVVFLVLNFANLATLWMAVFADLGASLIVVANGLRLLKFKR
jgi:Cd2+/Zn2+-exporting ATPase